MSLRNLLISACFLTLSFGAPLERSDSISSIEARVKNANSIPGDAFVRDGGIEAAVHGAPVWLFARVDKRETCYPESAVVLGSNPVEPNPGTDSPTSVDPGEDCTDPGEYHGAYSLGNPFPNYIFNTLCDAEKDTKTWRVNYNVYYVHDRSSGLGHKHDWEGATVIWGEDSPGSNTWHRDSWHEFQSVCNNGDLQDTNGIDRFHPKIYVGLFSHAATTTKSDWQVGDLDNGNEYRSDDFYYIPVASDMHLVSG